MHLSVDGCGVDKTVGGGAALSADMLVTGGDDGHFRDSVRVVHHPHVDDGTLTYGIFMRHHADIAEDEDGIVADRGDGVTTLSVGGGIDFLAVHRDTDTGEGSATAVRDFTRHRPLCQRRKGTEANDDQKKETTENTKARHKAQPLALGKGTVVVMNKMVISNLGDPVHKKVF